MNKYKILGVAICLSMLAGCYYDNKEELYPNTYGTQITCDTTNLTYINSIKTIIDGKCATSSCHGGAQPPNLTSYQNVINNISSIESTTLGSIKTMPKSSQLPVCEINKLQAWINAGTPQ